MPVQLQQGAADEGGLPQIEGASPLLMGRKDQHQRLRRLPRLAAVAAGCAGLLMLAVAGTAEADLQNRGLEADSNRDSIPDCWQQAGYGSNGYQYLRTWDAHSGVWAERVTISSWTSGDRKLITSLDSGSCAQRVTPGHRYQLGGWHKGDSPTQFVVYLRTSSGSWSYWTSSPSRPVSSTWRQATWTTPAVPSGSTLMGFGLNLKEAGSLTTDDYTLSDADTTPPDTTITSGPSGSTTATGASFSFTSSESPSTFACTLDGSKSPCTSPRTYTGLAAGQHTFTVAATDSAGNTDPTPATRTWTVGGLAPTSKTYSWGFDRPNCGNSLWGTEPWVSTPCRDADWNTQGLFYSFPDPDSPTGTKVLVQNPLRIDSTGTEQAWLHNPLTAANGTWGSEHRADIHVKPMRWGATALSHCSWAGGPKFFLGRPADKYETSTYTVELSVCDGKAYIQKKTWGTNECGKDPRAVDCTAGGTWYNLKQVSIPPATFGKWHTFSAIKRDNPDGSVTLIGIRDGTELLRYTETVGDIPNSPILRGGREGWRSNMIDWHMDDYSVTVKP